MNNRTPARFACLVAVLLAGCGGGGDGGSDPADLSTTPDSPAPVAAAPSSPPAPAPASAPVVAAPVGSPAPAPAPGAAPPAGIPDPAIEPAPVPKVSGELIWAALQTSISPDPAPSQPFTNYRRVYTADRYFLHLGGEPEVLQSHSYTTSPWGSLMRESFISVAVSGSDGVIDAVNANNLLLVGPQLDLRNVDPAVDAAAGTWTNGEWFAKLVVQSDESPDLMRVCWDVHLPPPPTVTGPPGTPPVVYTVPLKRLMCGVYSRTQEGPDVGGYVEDDFNGEKRIFRGSWQE